ncbi:hypothetical protein NJT12_06195 [Flavobacterium sp. AC]|uniref:Uncharacterized protein n=1 Tax=Flavobacterium azizsancarii TaxID=2961580 RepID=A0ABT4WAQ9_9FLAO|nr:hypothetical protein [Flavobacterium azizsancarii]MDA6069205.1 hypothetical protein [Flavobacterium azizsancarii]
MDIIKSNPYRIIGILVGTSTREEHSKTKKLKMYIEAGQQVPEDFSFPIIGDLNRSSGNVEDAISKLNLNSDRVNASLFWFYNGNSVTDEPMFDSLKASKEDSKEAINAWVKLATSEDVTKRNASAFQNLSTLYLNGAFKKKTISKKNLEKGIILKLKFLESDFINDFIKLSSDETYKLSIDTLQIQFLTQVYSQIEKVDITLGDWYLECISKISFTAKQNYLNDFVSKPIDRIKTKIEETKVKRKNDPSKGYDLGLSLFENENGKIKTIQNILGKSNIQFISASDKLSDEILQCGIVFFKKHRDTSTDPSAKAMDLFKKAKKLAVGSIAIQRCQENTENLQEWIDEKPERDKHNRISDDLTALIEIFDRFERNAETIGNARILINLSIPLLNNIKNILGASDEMYLKLSTRVASQAQSYIIEEVNNAQDNFDYKIAVDRFGTLNKIKTALRTGWEVTNLIGTLDMEYDYKTGRFNQNKNALKNLCSQLNVSTPSYSTSSLNTTPRPLTSPKSSSTYTAPKSNSGNINWGGWIFIIFFFIIVIMCISNGSQNDYSGDTNYNLAFDSAATVVDSAAAVVDSAFAYPYADTTAAIVDTASAVAMPAEQNRSPFIGNQLQNGSSPLDRCFGPGFYEGNAILTIKNGGNSDAIVCLYSTSKGRTIRNEYVQKNSNFKMSNIPQDYYKIRVFYGNDWNPNLENSCGTNGNFESDVNFSEFDGEEYFEDSSRGHTNATVTLYSVANGNASSSPINQSSFFNK